MNDLYRCEKRFTVVADPEQDYMLPVPRVCPAAARARPGGAATGKCGGTSLREIEGSKVCVDYQEIKIQDQVRMIDWLIESTTVYGGSYRAQRIMYVRTYVCRSSVWVWAAFLDP